MIRESIAVMLTIDTPDGSPPASSEWFKDYVAAGVMHFSRMKVLDSGQLMTDTFKPRRPYDDAEPEGYQESDQDFVNNNLDLCVAFLGALQASQQRIKEKS